MKKLIAMCLALVMALSLLAGCSSHSGSDSDALKIGMTGPLTGGNAVYGTAVQAGIEIAVEEINADPNNTLKLEFQPQDDEADGEKAVSGYNVLKDWGMQVFIGTVTSSACNAVAPLTVEDEIFLLTPSATAAEVATAGSSTFQMCFTDPNQGASAAEVIANNWPEAAIGIVYDASDDYSSGLYDGFKNKAAELSLNVVCETSFTGDTKSDLSTQVTMCKDAGADLMFLPIYYTEASYILNYASRIDYAPQYVGCDGMDGILNVEGFDTSLAEGMALLTPFDANATDEATQSFVAKYTEKTGEVPTQFAADAYDCVYAVYQAAVAAGVKASDEPADICAALIEQFTSMTFDGLTGKGMTWDSEGMISKAPAVVVIDGGIYVPMD